MVERLFGTVTAVRSAALRSPGVGRRGRRRSSTTRVRDLLRAPDQLAVGLGLVVAPQPERGLPLRLEWWQVDPDGGRLRTLEPDLKPTSLGYYDYTATEWFDVPRRTGRRHVVGPYVDVHGTGRYLLTLTEPVVVDGEFVGVAGADVSVRRFETHLLRGARPAARPVPARQRRGPRGPVDGTALAGREPAAAGRRPGRVRRRRSRRPVAAAPGGRRHRC